MKRTRNLLVIALVMGTMSFGLTGCAPIGAAAGALGGIARGAAGLAGGALKGAAGLAGGALRGAAKVGGFALRAAPAAAQIATPILGTVGNIVGQNDPQAGQALNLATGITGAVASLPRPNIPSRFQGGDPRMSQNIPLN